MNRAGRKKKDMEKVKKMKIRKIDKDKKQYLELLLLGDEHESMIDRYLEKGDMYGPRISSTGGVRFVDDTDE